MRRLPTLRARAIPILLAALSASVPCQPLVAHAVRLATGRTVTLNLPRNFALDVAAEGLPRVRFLAPSPDGRIFATGMHSLADNTQGKVYILEGWDPAAHRFTHITTYLDHLRNPNNLAFYTDPAGQSWLYLPLTDRLLRFRYTAGDQAPSTPPETLARYPDYGLNYKYGGWHLTRTVAIANLHGRPTVYVSVGSSCNACAEKEPVRATLTAMDPDGGHPRIVARGLRNAVGLVAVSDIDGGALFATNMGADHLGDTAPEDTFFELDSAIRPERTADYGWPTCFFQNGRARPDLRVSAPQAGDVLFPPPPPGPPPPQVDCATVPPAYTVFAAHSSPLGVAWFGSGSPRLRSSFLVALHGAGHPRIGTGYRVVRFSPGTRQPEDFVTGFLTGSRRAPAIQGRPCGLLFMGGDSFLLTDDRAGIVYFIHPAGINNFSTTVASQGQARR